MRYDVANSKIDAYFSIDQGEGVPIVWDKIDNPKNSIETGNSILNELHGYDKDFTGNDYLGLGEDAVFTVSRATNGAEIVLITSESRKTTTKVLRAAKEDDFLMVAEQVVSGQPEATVWAVDKSGVLIKSKSAVLEA
jgi:hypothetical protein